MTKAFVFGKFLPFHLGHEAMIRFALTRCDFLSVLVCCDQAETIPGETRKAWVEASFPNEERLEIRVLSYDNRQLPNTSVASSDASERWSLEFERQFPGYDLVVTSEPYGDLVASFMGIRHLLFDPGRQQYPVSASAIRKDLVANWHFLPAAVKPWYLLKVVILGTESTGKTTLTENLSRHYGCGCVLEAARELIPDSREFVFDDLHLVATEHAKRIKTAAIDASPLLIIDTDIHITRSYGRFSFKKELPVSDWICDVNKGDLYLYLNKDAPYHQDGTRLSKTDRDLLDRSHRATLADHKIKFVDISGSWKSRFEQAVTAVDGLLVANSTN